MKTDDPKNETQTDETEVSSDKISEEEFRLKYLEQQKRLSCPGCGETPCIF